VCENRVLRGIFGPKWNEVIGRFRKSQGEELHSFILSCSYQIKEQEMGRDCTTQDIAVLRPTTFWSENLKRRGQYEDIGEDSGIILK
jgi:hypothetical protein